MLFSNNNKKDKVVVFQVQREKQLAHLGKTQEASQKAWRKTLALNGMTEKSFTDPAKNVPTILYFMRDNLQRQSEIYKAIVEDPKSLNQDYDTGDKHPAGPKVTAYDGYERFVEARTRPPGLDF